MLLVDDIQEERELLGAWLERTAQFVVVGEACDGPTGVHLATQLHPDLVTLDMSMPGGDGMAALRQILLVQPDSKVAIVSGFVTTDLVHATVDIIGASACLDKGIGSDRLVQELLWTVESSGKPCEPPSDPNLPDALVDEKFLINARLAAIVESSDDAIIGKTLDGTITSWNAGAERLYGYRAAEMLGKNISILVPVSATGEFSGIMDRARSGEPIGHSETRRTRKDKSLVDVSLTVSPIRDSSGTVVGASTVARDVTARKLADEELSRQAEELRRSNEELEQFAYVASHDLSEPLRSISGFVELLARRYQGQIDEDADRFIKNAVDGCLRMRQLIDDLLTYSRAGHTVDLTPTDTSEVVSGVVTGMSAVLTESRARVEFADLPIVKGDAATLAQLFQNLVANAVKFARPGVAPRVQIDSQLQDGTWTFRVTDNGIGIEPQYRDRIFGMFQRLHARDAYPGTGIGLAICMRIVQGHGGRIWVDDLAAPGTRFFFTLQAVDEGMP